MKQKNDVIVSIVVPVYNTSRYLDECLASLVNQTLKEIEIICVNDASTDNSLEVLNSWALKDSRIKIIDLKENIRQGGARNVGIRKARGLYIGLVDSDDYISDDMYEMLVLNSKDYTVDIVVSNLWATHSDLDIFRTNFREELSDIESIKKSVLVNGCHMVTNIIKKELFKKYGLWYPENILYEDNANRAPLFLVADTINIYYNQTPMYFYRINNQSTMRSIDNVHHWDRLVTANMFLMHTKRLGLYERYQQEIEYSHYMLFVLGSFMFAVFSFTKYQYGKIKQIIEEYENNIGIKAIRLNRYYRSNESIHKRIAEILYYAPIVGYFFVFYCNLKRRVKRIVNL